MELFISESEKDLLKEIMNICVAKAADSFAAISGDKVYISVPDLMVISHERPLAHILEKETVRLIIHSEIKGDISGNSLLLFSRGHIDKLKDVCINDRSIDEDKEMVRSLLLEVSNIITGSLVTQLANILELNIYGSVPKEPIYTDEREIRDINIDIETTRSFLLTINTKFIDQKNEVGLPLVLIFDIDNMERILDIIRKKDYKDILILQKENGTGSKVA